MDSPSKTDLRPLVILSELARRDAAGAGELASSTGVSRATVYRVLESLEANGWVSASGSPKRFSVTPRVVELGISAIRRYHWRPFLLAAAIEFSAEVQLQSSIGIYDAGQVMIIDSVRRSAGRTSPILIGARAPALVTAAGKMLLSLQSSEEIERVIGLGLPEYTDFTIHDPDVIRQELNVTRERGYAVSDREFNLTTSGIAMAVRDNTGAPVAALGVSIHPLSADQVDRVVPVMSGYVERASLEVGYRGSMEAFHI